MGDCISDIGEIRIINGGVETLNIQTKLYDRHTTVRIMPKGDAGAQGDLSILEIYAQDVGSGCVGPFNRWSQRLLSDGTRVVVECLEHYRDKPPSIIRFGWRDAYTGAVTLIFEAIPVGHPNNPHDVPLINWNLAKHRNFVVE